MTGPTTGQVASVMELPLFAFLRAGQAEASWASAASGMLVPGWFTMFVWCSTLALVTGHRASLESSMMLGWFGGRTLVVVPTT